MVSDESVSGSVFGARRALGVFTLALMLVAAGSAEAVVRYAFGTNKVVNPSTVDNNERGPWKLSELINTDGPNVATGVAFTLAPDTNLTSGAQKRSFPGIAAVAQNSFSFRTSRMSSARLEAGAGAAATGPISFCPPIANDDPFAGNVNCVDGANNPGLGNYQAFIGIDQVRTGGGAPAGNAFGGTLKLARNVIPANVWFAKTPFIPLGNTTLVGVFSKKPNTNTGAWPNGRTNFFAQKLPNLKGPKFSAMVTFVSSMESGKIAGTPVSLMSTSPPTRPSNRDWGFQMTTGIVSGSDNTPAPTSFIFTGSDTTSATASGTIRNIVLIGGAISISNGGASSLPFNRIGIMDLTIVPEPIAAGGIAAGALGLLGLAWARRR